MKTLSVAEAARSLGACVDRVRFRKESFAIAKLGVPYALLGLLPDTPPVRSGVVPHPTRFVAMTGITRRGVETVVEWIRPIVNGYRLLDFAGVGSAFNASNAVGPLRACCPVTRLH